MNASAKLSNIMVLALFQIVSMIQSLMDPICFNACGLLNTFLLLVPEMK